MIDALVELVLHPMRIIGDIQQAIAVPFEIGEVKHTLFALELLIEFDKPLSRTIPDGIEFQCLYAPGYFQGLLHRIADTLMQVKEQGFTFNAHAGGLCF